MKNNIVLLIILLALIIASYLTINSNGSEGGEVRYLIPELQENINDVDTVIIRRNEKMVNLKKESGSWRVEQEGHFMADANKVATLLLQLRKMSLKEQKTSNTDNYGKLQLAESGDDAGIEIVLKSSDRNIADIYIGKRSPKTMGVYVRSKSEAQTWLAEGIADAKTDSKDWMMTTILDLDSSLFKSVTYNSTGGESFTISKLTPQDSDFSFQGLSDDKQIKSSVQLKDLANGLKSFAIESAIAKDDSIEPDLSVVYETFSGVKYILEASAKDDRYLLNLRYENDHNMTDFDKSLQDWTYYIPSYKFNAMNKKATDLLEDKPQANDTSAK